MRAVVATLGYVLSPQVFHGVMPYADGRPLSWGHSTA
jgi:hypothetical protein